MFFFNWSNETSVSMNNSYSNGSCLEYNSHYSDVITTLAVSMASLSFVACILVVVLILVLKKHHFLTQRLILYLTIAVMLNCFAIGLHKVHYELVNHYEVENRITQPFCRFIGYFWQNTQWFELMAVTAVTLNLFLHAVVKTPKPWLEILYLLLIFVLPLTFTWIPFINNAYGNAQFWCWIRKQDDNCKTFTLGVYLRFSIWFAPLYLILFILVVLYIIVICQVSRQRRSWDGNTNPMVQRQKIKLQKKVRPLIWYPLIYFLLHLFPLANRLSEFFTSKPVYVLWILVAIIIPLQGSLIALTFTLDTQTLRRLYRNRFKGTVGGIVSGPGVEEYPAQHIPADSMDSSSSSDDSEEEEVEEGEGGVKRRRRGRYTEFTTP